MIKNPLKSKYAAFPQAVFFDLDGTLVDSAPDLTAALNTTLSALKLSPVVESEVALWIGNGVDKLLQRALLKSSQGIVSDDDFWRTKNIFYHHYEKQSGHLSKLYPNVKKILDNLKQKHILVACITNKSRQFTLPLIESLGLSEYFDIVVCGDDLEHKKPQPDQLCYAAKQLKIELNQCTMIGDSKSDVLAANNAKIPVIAVDYGYSQGVDISLLNINAIVSDILEIENHFAECHLKRTA